MPELSTQKNLSACCKYLEAEWKKLIILPDELFTIVSSLFLVDVGGWQSPTGTEFNIIFISRPSLIILTSITACLEPRHSFTTNTRFSFLCRGRSPWTRIFFSIENSSENWLTSMFSKRRVIRLACEQSLKKCPLCEKTRSLLDVLWIDALPFLAEYNNCSMLVGSTYWFGKALDASRSWDLGLYPLYN